jgi:hypothetical protein
MSGALEHQCNPYYRDRRTKAAKRRAKVAKTKATARTTKVTAEARTARTRAIASARKSESVTIRMVRIVNYLNLRFASAGIAVKQRCIMYT